MLNKTLLFAKR